MTSTRKSRNVNRRSMKVIEELSDKDARTADKSKGRKRKLSDLLGSQWSKEELQHFYEAYRKYGKNWKKVASILRNRSPEMVEALYTMNKAYLSLPEGTATVAGLIAMMTDHYNILDGSETDKESNDASRTSRKPSKRGRGKVRATSKGPNEPSAEMTPHKLASSSYGCLSLLKKKQSGDILASSGRRAVGKRTPRIAIPSSFAREDMRSIISPNKQVLRSQVSSGDDDGLHVAALALAQAYQRGDSPQVSRTPRRTTNFMRSSPARSRERKITESDVGYSKFTSPATDGDNVEGSIGSREADNAELDRDVSHPMDTESIGIVETHEKVKRPQKKGKKEAESRHYELDDEREACSGTEEGPSTKKSRDKSTIEVTGEKGVRASKVFRKRNRQLFFGDESSGLDALQTLADLSLNILLPACTGESESSAQVRDDKEKTDAKPNLAEYLSTNDQKDRSDIFGKKEKVSSAGQHENKSGSGVKQQNEIGNLGKRKRKPSLSKIAISEPNKDANSSVSQKKEVPVEEGKRLTNKNKRVAQVTPSKEGKSVKSQEHTCSSTNLDRLATESVDRNAQVALIKKTDLPKGSANRRKLNLKKSLSRKDLKSKENISDGFSDIRLQLGQSKEMLSHCLSSQLLRRWCVFEWFYSAIDYPWFAQSEFVEYLNHVRLGHIPRLTRDEWGVIRSSLGKPRRLSSQFLQEEREKLVQYRESVRSHYTELRAGLREGLPTDLARPLSVGQRVIACHPKTREIHDGSILTVDRNRCRVQFDRPELGVEFVMDIDCMPMNPSENMPEALRRSSAANRFNLSDVKLEGQIDWNSGSSFRPSPTIVSEITDGNSNTINTLLKQAKGDTIDAITQAKATANEAAVAAQQAIYTQPCTLAQLQAREADIRALVELARSLDKKEALLIELRHMNEEVSSKLKDGDPIKSMEHFRKQYAAVLLQMRDVNDHVASALIYLRQRNTYHGPSRAPWSGQLEYSSGSGVSGSLNSVALLSHDPGSYVMEIVESSRQKASSMVATSLQAIRSLKEGDDAFSRIGDALASTNKQNSGSSSGLMSPRQDSFAANGDLSNQEHASTCTSDIAFNSQHHLSSDSKECQLPSELISSCVGTLLMIQSCSARQYPPAEVAQILDIAVTSLQPCCQQNLPIYREIETCMGIIKNQMLALIPTPVPPYSDPMV